MKRRKILHAVSAVVLSVAMTLMSLMSSRVTIAATNPTYTALGADLTAEQKETVLSLLRTSKSDITEDTSVTVTNAEEHEYLDKYLDQKVIGTKALSSCKVTPARNGEGIQVETHNINFITPSMYQNALATAGMKNAVVIVAAPFPISGTAALIGAMKAYAKMSGQVIDPIVLEAATEELITSGELAEEIGDADKSAELVAAVKQVVAENELKDESDIRDVIINISNQLNINISDAQLEKLVALMREFSALDVNAKDLTEQARGIYEKAAEQGLDLSAYGISQEDVSGFFSKLPGLLQAIINWLKGIFG